MDEGGRPLISEPFMTEFDIVTDLSGKGDAKAWRNLRSFAREETSSLKTRLERALSDDEQTHWRREQERGELDRHALAKLAISPGYRTSFRVKSVIEGRDTAVSILMLLSDGYPATGDGHPVVLRNDLHEHVREIAHGGIELIGVGIRNDSVKKFYPTSIVVSTLHELPERAFRVLAGKLLER